MTPSFPAFATFSAFVALVLYARRSRLDANLAAIRKWSLTMDIQAYGQRYLGERCELLHVFFGHPRGWSGASARYLCRTRSGRCFEIEMECVLCEVLRWQLTPVDPGVAEAFLSKIAAPGAVPAAT